AAAGGNRADDLDHRHDGAGEHDDDGTAEHDDHETAGVDDHDDLVIRIPAVVDDDHDLTRPVRALTTAGGWLPALAGPAGGARPGRALEDLLARRPDER